MSAASSVKVFAISVPVSSAIFMPFAIALNVPAICFADSSESPKLSSMFCAQELIELEPSPKDSSTTFCTSCKSDAVSNACLPKNTNGAVIPAVMTAPPRIRLSAAWFAFVRAAWIRSSLIWLICARFCFARLAAVSDFCSSCVKCSSFFLASSVLTSPRPAIARFTCSTFCAVCSTACRAFCWALINTSLSQPAFRFFFRSFTSLLVSRINLLDSLNAWFSLTVFPSISMVKPLTVLLDNLSPRRVHANILQSPALFQG